MADLFPAKLSDGPASAARPRLVCRLCGSTPAAMVIFEEQTGTVVFRQSRDIPGPLCRDCGLFAFRTTTAHTLGMGWIGAIAFFTAPFVLIQNLLARRKVARLGPPQPPPGRRPFDPGRPVYLRWKTAFVLIPVTLIGLVGMWLIDDLTTPLVGRCVALPPGDSGTLQRSADYYFVDCDESHNGVVIGTADNENGCPPETITTLGNLYNGQDEPDWVYCLGEPGA